MTIMTFTGIGTWVFPKIRVPQIIHFNRVFHYFHHPFWVTLFLETLTSFGEKIAEGHLVKRRGSHATRRPLRPAVSPLGVHRVVYVVNFWGGMMNYFGSPPHPGCQSPPGLLYF